MPAPAGFSSVGASLPAKLGDDMQKSDRIDFAKLLGFELVTRELLENFDLQDATVGAKLGAKVGDAEETGAPEK